MKQKNAFCLLLGDYLHHLDHIAPLSIELNIPLLLIDPTISQVAETFYPNLRSHFTNDLYLMTEYLPKADVVISCFSNVIFKKAFSMIKEFDHVWLPHGHSDKGFSNEKHFEPMAYETNLMIYGNNMKNTIKRSGVNLTDNYSIIKNYRYYHFLKNKDFYSKKLEDLNIKTDKPVLLYAPTWKDTEENGSFSSFSKFLGKLTKDFFVICKWHPNLLKQEKELIEQIENEHKDASIIFLHTFPLIYPLLSITDLYLGDVSSIGYDFLTFEKPMIFLNEHKENLPLFSCGQVLKKQEYKNIDTVLKSSIDTHKKKYLPQQKKLYEYTFGKKESIESFNKNCETIREKILCYTQKNLPV